MKFVTACTMTLGSFSLSTIAYNLTECLKLTWKKVQKVHPNQSLVKQAECIDAIADLQPEMLVFAGESFKLMKAHLSNSNFTMNMAELSKAPALSDNNKHRRASDTHCCQKLILMDYLLLQVKKEVIFMRTLKIILNSI
ncbi:hypothetical protein CROQUDRAFT_683258 [Cronartium quercuum f. sp. fusiforme G11]|uniref:Uncharacterized protein n=1 Tax=Cronartium quercuum f. sp. fusiforme G11 TaxID=708437 RepID=A0A9P6NE61_9BASI|nr:hypothetical protein CROQUDRAFT_683258 [Cronartium quercuum f. sp. fusiforme G11]